MLVDHSFVFNRTGYLINESHRLRIFIIHSVRHRRRRCHKVSPTSTASQKQRSRRCASTRPAKLSIVTAGRRRPFEVRRDAVRMLRLSDEYRLRIKRISWRYAYRIRRNALLHRPLERRSITTSSDDLVKKIALRSYPSKVAAKHSHFCLHFPRRGFVTRAFSRPK